jgi:cysteine synthase A
MINANPTRQLIYGLLIGVILTLSTNSFINWWKRKKQDGNKKNTRELKSHKQLSELRNDIADGIEGLIGNTPLMRIKSLSVATGCEILVNVLIRIFVIFRPNLFIKSLFFQFREKLK